MTSDLYTGISKETHAMTFVPLCRHLSKEIDRTGKNEMLMFDLWQYGLDIELFWILQSYIQWTEEKFAKS